MMTKEEKTAKLQEIEEQVEDFYTEDEAGEDAFKITYSYMVKSWRDRHLICAILAHTGATERSFENLAAEWRFHNAAFRLHLQRRSARDVDLDYTRDPRWPIRAVTAVLDWLDIE